MHWNENVLIFLKNKDQRGVGTPGIHCILHSKEVIVGKLVNADMCQ